MMFKDTQKFFDVQIYCIAASYLCAVNGSHPRCEMVLMFLLFYILCGISFIPELFNEKR